MVKRNILMLLVLFLTIAAFSQTEIEEVSLTNVSDINTNYEDFFAIPYRDGILYNTIGAKNPCDTCGYLFGLRYAEKKEGTECNFNASESVVSTIVAKKSNFNIPTFTRDGKTMYITQNFKKSGGGEINKKESKLKIVSTQLNEDSVWTNFKDLPFNQLDYETAHPALSKDGQIMYFASDRPGGFGKMDIWMVERQGTTWGEPVNLGAAINSADNELFPSITQDDNLCFSSNKSGGMGKLDIYCTTRKDGIWTTTNMGVPFNSAADDLGYIEAKGAESGYITSNRRGGKGKDDLYFWKVNQLPVILVVENARNAQLLPNSSVRIIEINNDADTLALQTDEEGITQFDVTFRRYYEILVEKEGYQSWRKIVNVKDLATNQPYVIALEPIACPLLVEVNLSGSQTAVPNSKVILTNKTTKQTLEGITGANGIFIFDTIYCFENYEVQALKDDRSSKKESIAASTIDCTCKDTTKITLRLPVPFPPSPPCLVCNCYDAGLLSLPLAAIPKPISSLGSRPEFGNVHDLGTLGFFDKLKRHYKRKKRDAVFLDELFMAMGYTNGFADASEYLFSDVMIPNGRIGNMGYSKRHRIQYVQLNAKKSKDLAAFKVSSKNGCDVYFMKTCGNLFFFCEERCSF